MSDPDSDDHLASSHAHGSRHDRGCLVLTGRACTGDLAPGQAMTLRIRHAGQLQVRGERLWMTFWRASEDCTVRAGDHFVEPGQQLVLQAHEAVVIEPSARSGQLCRSAQFHWQPAPTPLGALRRGLAGALRALADRVARPTLLAQT